MKKVMCVFGTRPEAIKMAPVIKALKEEKNIETVVCLSGQHKEMLDSVLSVFSIKEDYNLDIMKDSQTLFDITTLILNKIKPVLEKEKPDLVLVHGDTSTSFAAGLACFYLQISAAHVEAGLRTYDMYAPYPEEFNRQAIGLFSKLHFAPTKLAKENLLKEGKKEPIYVTGNTAIDALKTTVHKDYKNPYEEFIGENRLILLTSHRRENIGTPMKHIFQAIKNTVDIYEDVKVIYPIHKNPKVRQIADEVFKNHPRIKLIEPLDVIAFHNLMNASYLIMSDSGGIQEEAPSLGKPVLVLRDTTERPEGVKANTLKMVGTNQKNIEKALQSLLDDKLMYAKMSQASNPYGDGFASKRIVEIIVEYLK